MKVVNKSWNENVLNISKYKQQFREWKRENEAKSKLTFGLTNKINLNNKQHKKVREKPTKQKDFNKILNEMDPSLRLETVAFQCIFGRQQGRKYKKLMEND